MPTSLSVASGRLMAGFEVSTEGRNDIEDLVSDRLAILRRVERSIASLSASNWYRRRLSG